MTMERGVYYCGPWLLSVVRSPSDTPNGKERVTQKRHRFQQTLTLSARLEQEAARLGKKAKHLPLGTVRERLIRRDCQVGTATHVDEWLLAPGLQAQL